MERVAGIDVSKASLDVSFLGKSKSFRNDHAGHKELASWLKKPELVVMEATGSYHFELACFLHDQGFKVAVVNPARPHHYAKSLGKRIKTDKVDARVLAEFGKNHELTLFAPPPDEARLLIRLVRMRSDLVSMRSQAKNRLHDPGVLPFELTKLAEQVAFFSEQIEEIEKNIRELIKATEALKKACTDLRTIPGIGEITAWTLLSELPDVSQFASAKKIGAYAGLCPSSRESGSSLKGSGRLCKQGNATLRKSLYMSAIAASRLSNPFGEFYNKLVAKGKKKMTAIIAVMHKLLRVAYGVLKTGMKYDPNMLLTAT